MKEIEKLESHAYKLLGFVEYSIERLFEYKINYGVWDLNILEATNWVILDLRDTASKINEFWEHQDSESSLYVT